MASFSNSVKGINKGGFHRWLGKPQGAPITAADIAKGRAAGGHPAKMANLAATFHKINPPKASASKRVAAKKAGGY